MTEMDPFARLEERRARRDAERLSLTKRLHQLNQEAEEDAVAAKVLLKLYPEHVPAPAPQLPEKPSILDRLRAARTLAASTPSPASVAATQDSGAGLKLKDMILNVLREAYPNGLKAQQIRGKVQIKYRTDLNPNTLTVTLVRYSKGDDPRARCEGRTWYYVRPSTNGVVADHKEEASA